MSLARSSDLVRRHLPELVYGANDGLVTTFAIVSGVVGADLSSNVVLVLGFASLFADGVSMGASNFLSLRTPGAENEDGEISTRTEAFRHGLATFTGFLLIGCIPLIAYVVPMADQHRFTVTAVLTLTAMFLVGAGRAVFAERSWFRAGLEMLLIGTAAASIAYGVGQLGSLLMSGPSAAVPM